MDYDPRGNKKPFNGVLFGIFSLCILVGCIPGHNHFTKAVLVPPITWIAYYLITETTTGDLSVDLGVGSALLTQVLTALDAMYFTDPNTLINYHEPLTGKITEKPLAQRIRWAFNLYTNNRGIGWAHEPSDLPEKCAPSTSRRRFVLARLTLAGMSVLAERAVFILAVSNPAMNTPGQLVSEAPFLWRALAVASFGAAGASRINAMSCVVSALVVGLGFSTPDRWPNLFGSPLDAWSVRRFWRKVWHQLLRKNLVATSRFILTDVLGLPPVSHKINNKILSTANTILWLHLTFLVSALLHVGGEYMFLGRMGYGTFRFFCLQPVGITLETIVALAWSQLAQDAQQLKQDNATNSNSKAINGVNGSKTTAMSNSKSKPKAWVRCVGYVWVACWFTYSLPFMINPMLKFKMFVDPQYDLRTNGWIFRN